MYKLPRLLSGIEAAERAGVAEQTYRTYRSAGGGPVPDGHTGRTPGWLPSTIDDWAARLPGKGTRTDLRAEPPGRQPPANPVAAATELLALVRALTDASVLDVPDRPAPRRSPAGRLTWDAAGHLARAGVAYDMLPWVELADDLHPLDGEVEDAEQAGEILRIVGEHVGRARARLEHRRAWPDWDDPHAVHGELEYVARRAADLRLVQAVDELLAKHTEEG